MVSPTEIILVPTIMIIVGFSLKRLSILNAHDSKILSSIVLNVSLPSLIFLNLSKANITNDMLILPVLALILSFILMCIAYVFCKIRGYSKKVTWTIMIASAMMNTGFFGFPITLGVFGNDGFLHAIFFDLSTTILFVVFGMILVKEFGGDKTQVIKRGLLFVPLWSVVLAIIFNILNIQLGYVVENVLNYLGQSTIPLIMISLGLTIDFREIKHSISNSAFVAVVKLVISPIIIFFMLSILHIGGMSFNVAILEAGMSTAMNALVLAITYGLDTKLMSSVIFTNTLLSLISLTFIIGFLT